MKKHIVLFFVVFLVLASTVCFAQNAAARQRALQGTWQAVAIMNSEECYEEADLRAAGLVLQLIISNNQITLRSNGEQISRNQFTASEDGFIVEGRDRTAYLIQGNLLITHDSSGITMIYRKQ